MIASVLVAVCNLFYPTIAKNIINDYAYRDTLKPIIIGASLLLLIYVIKAVCNWIVGYYGHVIGVRMQADMRRDLFIKYQSLPFTYFDNHKTGDLLSRLTSDLQGVSELAHHGPENLFLAILMLTGSFVILININVTLTLIMFAVIPFIVLFAALSRKSMMSAMSNSHKQMAEVNTALENSISGIRETKAYVADGAEICKFDSANGMFRKFRSDAMRSLGKFHSIMEFMSDFLYLVIIFIGGLFLMYGKIDAGEFAAFILYIGMFMTPIQRFVTLFEQLQEGMAGFSRFYEIMNTEGEIDEGEIELDTIKGDIEFKNVSFGYDTEDKRMVISNLDLKLDAGKTLALVGPSGGGKSTLCHLLPRFYNVTSGEITIDGNNICDVTLKSLRKNIGIVSQSIFLFDGTVRDNITYGTEKTSEQDIIDAAQKANIYDFIMSLPRGFDTEVGERGVKLSGGQRQRIAIARVFLKNPKLLILDEATSALDNVTEMQIQSALSELSRGRTVIVVAHRLSTVKNADEIVVLDSTGIVERGTHDQLLAQDGEYARLYSYQFKQDIV